jgi:hypothetical protein
MYSRRWNRIPRRCWWPSITNLNNILRIFVIRRMLCR